MDPLMLLILLIAGHTGVSTVKRVSVQRGGSVTIPCFYGDRYKTHVKYWCRLYNVSSCPPIVRSDSPQEGKVSIRDDPDQRVFTVTINNLTAGDSGTYLCGVEISGGLDVVPSVFLSVTEGVSTLSRVTVQRGGSVTIPCFYGDRYKTHVKYWCRGDYRDSCTPIVHSDSPQEGKVSIRDDPDQQVFTVTINDVTAGDSDYYWCGVEISGGSDVGDQVKLLVTHGSPWLSVDKQEATGVEGDSVSVQCRYGNNESQVLWCKFWGYCASKRSGNLDGRPVLIRDDRVNRVFSVTMRGLERKDTGWYWCAAQDGQIPVHITVKQGENNENLSLFLYVGLGLLVLLLIIIIITWKVRDKHNKKMSMNQNPGRIAFEEPGADVIYSSIVLSDPKVSSGYSSYCPAVTPASDVVYSSVALKHKEV
ncbi:polymeric immunoglobulin receptor-like isoform X2 [Paramormyrops kingsleyae]|uniref:polymeric immunoglobulin receptor-like isoform X2 n=1 Tax=Paramormyrops kingsleyae TaxID=1676925 RepID=UPI003B970267